jgi:hypothetical protein
MLDASHRSTQSVQGTSLLKVPNAEGHQQKPIIDYSAEALHALRENGVELRGKLAAFGGILCPEGGVLDIGDDSCVVPLVVDVEEVDCLLWSSQSERSAEFGVVKKHILLLYSVLELCV